MYLELHAGPGRPRRGWPPTGRTASTTAQSGARSSRRPSGGPPTAAQRVVGRAMDVVGGGAFFRRHELERLYRDVRAGVASTPTTDAFTHEPVAKTVLAIPEDAPRF